MRLKYRTLVVASITMPLMLVLTLLSSFRYGMGTDYFTYESIYNSYGQAAYTWLNLEPLFVILLSALKSVSESPRIFFVSTSFIFGLFMCLGWFRYSKSPLISLFVFLGFFYYFNSFNIIRQSLAMAIVFLFATKYLASGEFYKYLVVIIFSAMMHYSAIVMVPLYFMCRKSYSIYFYFFCFLVFVFLYFLYSPVMNFISLMLPKYAMYQGYRSGSANLVLCVSLFFITFSIFHKKIVSKFGSVSIVSMNMAFFSLPFLVLSNHNIIFYRVFLYPGMYFMILIPAVVFFFKYNHQRVVFSFFVIFVMIVMVAYGLLMNVSGVFPVRFSF